MTLAHRIGNTRHTFDGLRELLAKATPLRSGDVLAGAMLNQEPRLHEEGQIE